MSDNANELQILVFEMTNKEGIVQKFGLNIFKVQEILTQKKCTELVTAPPEIMGVIQSRDELITLLDLSMVLYGVKADTTKESLIVICHSSNKKIGLLVSSVSNIVDTNWNAIKNVDEMMPEGNGLVNGLVDFEDKLISVMNLEELFMRYLSSGKTTEVSDIKVTQKDLSNMNVLVIDDSKWSQKIIENGLKKENIHYHSATDGKDGLEKIEAAGDKFFNLVLCDIEMPRMNGYTFLQEVKGVSAKGKTVPPVVMYSSLCDDVSIDRAKKLGATHYVTKYNLEKLLKSVEEYVAV